MFCPVCEAEYEAGITQCPDDDTPLVNHLTTENALHDPSEARFVSLFSLGSPAEAEMVNDILRNNGIRSAVQSGGNDAFAPLLASHTEFSCAAVTWSKLWGVTRNPWDVTAWPGGSSSGTGNVFSLSTVTSASCTSLGIRVSSSTRTIEPARIAR
jgi:hypothetical protein